MWYCPTPTLYLNLALTGDCAFQLSPKKPHSVWFISVLKSGDMGQCPEKSPSPCNTCVIPVSLYKSMSWFVTKTRTHTHTHARTHTHTHTQTTFISLLITLPFKTAHSLSAFSYWCDAEMKPAPFHEICCKESRNDAVCFGFKGIVHPKMNICWKCPHPQAI